MPFNPYNFLRHRFGNQDLSQAEVSIQSNPWQYRADLDGLRAVAIISVLGFHAFPSIFPGGFIGVDVFFVISGFLISGIIVSQLQQNSFTFNDFYARRIRRIFPALLLVLIACFALGWFVLIAGEFKSMGKHIAGSAAFISNFVFWSESGYFNATSEEKPLLHLWSLGVEEQFYVMWPALLWATRKHRISMLLPIFLLGVASFGLNVAKVNSDSMAAFFSPQTRLWEFLVGAALSYLSSNPKTVPDILRIKIDVPVASNFRFRSAESSGGTQGNLYSLLGMAIICCGIAIITANENYPGWWALLPVGGTALVIYAGKDAWFNRVVLSNTIAVWIGLISFPLYLWHWPLLSFAFILENKTPSFSIRLIAITLSVVLAWATFLGIEKPIRFGAHKQLKVAALVGLMAAVGLLGWGTYEWKGLAYREADKLSRFNSFDSPPSSSCKFLTGNSNDLDSCHLGTGDATRPEIALIGDSIATTYYPVLATHFANSKTPRNFINIGRGQCPMLFDFGPTYCREITTAGYEFIKSHASIHTIVLTAQWHRYNRGAEFKWENSDVTAKNFQNSLKTTLAIYKSLGKQVIVLLTPPSGANPKGCILRRIRLSDNEECVLLRQTENVYAGQYRDKLLPILQAEHIPYFDPIPYFCDDKVCRTVDGTKILFRDKWHLSIYGGEYLAIQAKVQLDELFDDSKSTGPRK